jgi:hypothetical protein
MQTRAAGVAVGVIVIVAVGEGVRLRVGVRVRVRVGAGAALVGLAVRVLVGVAVRERVGVGVTGGAVCVRLASSTYASPLAILIYTRALTTAEAVVAGACSVETHSRHGEPEHTGSGLVPSICPVPSRHSMRICGFCACCESM